MKGEEKTRKKNKKNKKNFNLYDLVDYENNNFCEDYIGDMRDISHGINNNEITSIEINNKLLTGKMYSTYKKNIDFSEIVDFFLKTREILCKNNKLIIYISEEGYWKTIEEGSEILELNRYIELETRKRIPEKIMQEVVKKLKNEPSINKRDDEFNSNENLVNCKNGVLNILTGTLTEHDYKYLFTYCINANYLEEINDYELNNVYYKNFYNYCKSTFGEDYKKVKFLLEIIGYLISDINRCKKAFIFVGKPHSGKSLLTRIIIKLIGEKNVSNVPFNKLGDRFSKAEFSTHKININAEMNTMPIKNIETFKALVGNDYISAEYKGKPLFNFKSKIKLLFCGNSMPEIKDMECTEAFVDRLLFLVFPKSVNREKMDYKLEEKLEKELDYIFTLAMESLQKLMERNYDFTLPDDSKKFEMDYRNNQNHINDFINDCCELGEAKRIHTTTLYSIYIKFCKNNCISPYKQRCFGEYINNIEGVERGKFRLNGKNLRGFIGISIKNQYIL